MFAARSPLTRSPCLVARQFEDLLRAGTETHLTVYALRAGSKQAFHGIVCRTVIDADIGERMRRDAFLFTQ
jgi:hypothetical protein